MLLYKTFIYSLKAIRSSLLYFEIKFKKFLRLLDYWGEEEEISLSC